MQPWFPFPHRTGAGRVSARCAPTWATWLLLLALVLRGMIPLGYMPNPGTTGGLTAHAGPFIPCVGGQHGDTRLGPDQGHDAGDHTGHHPDGNTPPCVFAAIAALAACLTVLLALPMRQRLPQTWDGTGTAPRPRLPPPGTRLARGPPRLS